MALAFFIFNRIFFIYGINCLNPEHDSIQPKEGEVLHSFYANFHTRQPTHI
jgi:hypothetical protein